MSIQTPDDPALSRDKLSVSVKQDSNIVIEPLWTNVIPPDEPFGGDPNWVAARFDNPVSVRAPLGVNALKVVSNWPGDWKWTRIDVLLKLTANMINGTGPVEDVIALKEKIKAAKNLHTELIEKITAFDNVA